MQRSRPVKQLTLKAEPQATGQCHLKISQIKREALVVPQDCKGSPCGEETESQTLVCEYCGANYLKKYHLLRHFREVHRTNLDLICKECGKQCSSSGALYHHKKTHLPPAYECADCGTKYERKKTLALHWHRVHGGGTQVQREVCESSKPPRSNSTSVQVLLSCRDCDKTYKSATGLSRHRASIHLQRFPHCCYICGQAFTQKSSLLRHQKVHEKTRPFQCRYCIGSFKDKWHLTQHERIHTGAKPYVCSICKEAYKLKAELCEHVRAVHETSERKCPDCTHTCKTFGALASHWKIKHASEWVHRNSTEGHNSLCNNEEIPSLSIEWRNKHAIVWADPKTRKKRERINIALLEELAEAEVSMNNDSGELALCINTAQTGSLSQDIQEYCLSLNLSSFTSNSDEVTEECVLSTDTVKENVIEGEKTAGHCETKVNGVLMPNKRMVLQPIEIDTISGISEASRVNSRGKQNKSRKLGMNMKMKKKEEEEEHGTDLEKLKAAILTKALQERSINM